ncbi:hypothetical protein [Rhizobium leguminosarum]|uniref:hypothetical protein n=1 Tax=Rhizobium leguminosarum TaxID=384 RepID=UPI0021BBCB73
MAGAPAQAIIPDGCADIIVFGDEAPHIAAPARTTQRVNPPPIGTLISGIRFRPGAVRRILGCDAIELPDWSVELEAVCGRRSWPLLAELRAAGRSDVSRRAALAGWARHQLDQNTEADHLVLRAGAMLILGRQGVIEPGTTGERAEEDIHHAIDDHINTDDIILLLVGADFIASYTLKCKERWNAVNKGRLS